VKESRSNLEQRADPAADFGVAGSWGRYAGEDLEEGALSRSVVPDDPDYFSTRDLKRE
jgi:hypothetical protein